MIMRLVSISLAALFLFTTGLSCAVPADKDSGVIISPGFSFGITTPVGWLRTATDYSPAAFHPSQFAFDRSPVIIYVRSASKAGLRVKSIPELNAFDIKGMRVQWPKISSKPSDVWSLPKGLSAPTYRIGGGSYKYQEIVAYIEHPKSITVFVLSAESETLLTSSIKPFRALVESYHWLPELSAN
jgi:hypothetical protein